MTTSDNLKVRISALLSANITLLLVIFALGLISAIWATTVSRIEFEHQTEIHSTMRLNDYLARAFAETIHSDLADIDDVLLFIKREFESNGKVTPSILARIENSNSIPVNHISVMDEQGTYIASSLPLLVSRKDADRQYFRVHVEADTGMLYIGDPVVGRVTGKRTFHVSRRLNKPDGSFAGVVIIGVDPSSWANFYRELKLGDDSVITLVGRDGIIRLRQTGWKTEDRIDIKDSPLFRHLLDSDAGSFIDTAVIDHARRIFNYTALQDYPLIVNISVLESEALKNFYQRRDGYYWTATIASVILLGVFWLLIVMVEEQRRAKNELEIKVAQRTQQLQDMNDEQLTLNEELQAMNDELQRLSQVDGLTGIVNRRYFDELLDREWYNAIRQQNPLALIMADVDFFKVYNDTYGHQSGDECLKAIAFSLRDVVKRATDIVARYGGEEFAIILPDTDIDSAMVLAEKIRARIESLGIEHKNSQEMCITISLGVAVTVPSLKSTPASLILLADLALYQAKLEGRNRVRLADQEL